ncbi:MAG: hypothetical protein JXR25_16975 [Pontiellaceae bacterium]|nr:hypothetical protein [Pontiellaceae bacterium]MBN2786515.1 hypothetical protein [Pontiellaceae bacterium]
MADGMLHFAFIGPGIGESFVVVIVLIVLFGSKDAPRILRKLNGIIGNIRSTADHFKHEVLYGDLSVEMDEHESDDVDLAVYEEEGAEDISLSDFDVIESGAVPEEDENGDSDETRV